MTHQRAAAVGASFMDTGMDWSLETQFTPDEKNRLLEWYETHHGDGDLSLVRFAPFLIEHLPAAFKLTRRHVESTMAPHHGVSLPAVTNFLFNLYSFPALGFSEGVMYELIGARHLGAPKSLVMDVLNYAFLVAGERGFNSVAELSDEYLRGWHDAPELPAIEWPTGWSLDPGALSAGMDSSHDMSSTDRAAIARWHERSFGEVPVHVSLFAEGNGRAFKLQRYRYELALGSVMPVQLAPLLTLHLATIRLQEPVMRRAVLQARALRVRRHHVVQTLYAGMRQMLVEPVHMEAAAQAVSDVIAGWTE